jgi:hypothetical protein
MDKVQVIRLTTGEEVIAFAEKVKSGYKIDKPGLIVPTENGVGIMVWMPYTVMQEKETILNENVIAFVTQAVSGLEEQYRKINSTIDLPPEKKLIL